MSQPFYNSQAFLAAIVDSTDEAVIGKSLDGKVLSWSKGAEKIYGYKEGEIVGLDISIIIPPDRKQEKDIFLNKIKQGQNIDHYETLRIRKDKVLINVSLTISPIKNSVGEIIAASTIARDITKQKRFEERLKSEQNKTQTILDNVVDGIITINEKGSIQSFNPASERIFGFSKDEVLGKNVKFLMPEPYHSEHDRYLNNYLSSGVAKIINIGREVEGLRKNKTVFPLELAISEVYVGEDRLFTGIVRDISERKQMEEQLLEEKSRSQAILDNVVDGIITINEKGSIQSFNPASERIFGFSKDEVLGKNVKFLMPEPYHSEHDRYLNNYLSSGVAKIINIGREVEGLRKDKTVFPLELAISEVYVGEDRLFTGIVRDISERKRFENALKDAKERADSANLSKSRFLANMSHEIRTPMNAILGYSQILLRNPDLNRDIRDIIKTMGRSGQNLLALINEILDISKIEAGKMELKPVNFDLQTLIKEMDSLFALRCIEEQLTWNVNNLLNATTVYGDETKLRQVLINLIGNAVKFTDSGEIRLSVTPLEQNIYQFEVKDTGEGIPLESQKHIFEPFQQDESGHKKGGTGLGLAICQKQLELMDSKLQLESEPNQGARFFFDLKLPPAEGAIESQDLLPGNVSHLAPGLQVKALVVDDVIENRDVLKRLLTLIGLDVVVAENGEEAIKKVREFSPDIIYMDMRMPVMDGEEATRLIQEEFGHERFKIVAITASTLDARRDYYLNKGFHEFIGKPFKEEQVFKSLKDLLNVGFVYEAEDSSKKPAEVQEEFEIQNISLPEELLNKMKKAAELHKITDLELCIAELDSLDGEMKGLKDHLSSLLKSYDIEKISNFLNKVSAIEKNI